MLSATVVAMWGMQVTAPVVNGTAADIQICGAIALDRDNRRQALVRLNADIDQKTMSLQDLQDKTRARRSSIDQRDENKVKRFNADVKRTNDTRTSVQTDIDTRDAAVTGLNDVITQFNARCAGRNFDPQAVAALSPDQRAALSGNLATHMTTRLDEPVKHRPARKLH